MNAKQLKLFRKKFRRIEREIEYQLKYETACCGVSLAQCHTIMEIGDHETTSLAELTKLLNLDKSTLSRTVDGLVKLGIVERIIDPDDRRYIQVTLSEIASDGMSEAQTLHQDSLPAGALV